MAEVTSLADLRAQCSAELGLRFRGVVTTVVDPTITVPELDDRFSEALAPVAGYLWRIVNAVTDFRRIDEFVVGKCTLNRTGGGFTTDDVVDAFLILPPSDWNEQINLGLRGLYYIDPITVNPVDGQSLYAIADTWLQTETQVERVYWRHTTTGSPAWTTEQDVAVYRLIPNANAFQLLIEEEPPADVDELDIVIEGRHRYEELATEVATTTCPVQLAKTAAKLKVLEKIWHIMGDKEAKAMFGAERATLERALVDEKTIAIRQHAVSPIHVDRAQSGPELPVPASFRW